MLKDRIKTIYFELKSYFVPIKQDYLREGECNKCGECCRTIYSLDTYSVKEFHFMQFIYPPYRRFFINGKDEEGNFIFSCKYIQEDGKCSVYDKRPKICRNYPKKKLSYSPNLSDKCGYKYSKKDFKEYLK